VQMWAYRSRYFPGWELDRPGVYRSGRDRCDVLAHVCQPKCEDGLI
jgi:hypothetical protein